MTPRDDLEQQLNARHVSPVIIDRVLRLSAPYNEGEILRGIHRSCHDDPRHQRDCTTKGDVIRRFGREVWDRIPTSRIFKRGRRKYATRQEIQRAMQ